MADLKLNDSNTVKDERHRLFTRTIAEAMGERLVMRKGKLSFVPLKVR